MRILVLSSLLIATLIPHTAVAKVKVGPSGACIVDNGGFWGKDKFWYCGSQNKDCAGENHGAHEEGVWQYDGNGISLEGTTYWCCDGTKTNKGKYKQAKAWKTTVTAIEEFPGGGKCSWQKTTDACGRVTGTKCTEPDNCPGGKIGRNGECVTPPDINADQAFDGATSNTIVTCETTSYQGIDDDSNCVRCDKQTELFVQGTKSCIKRADVTQFSKMNLHDCWRCANDTSVYRTCVEAASKNKAMTAAVKKACGIEGGETLELKKLQPIKLDTKLPTAPLKKVLQ